MSQFTAPLSTKHTAHSVHATTRDLRGFNFPRAQRPPSTAWIRTHQVSWLPLR
jgi:hypothetical protein